MGRSFLANRFKKNGPGRAALTPKQRGFFAQASTTSLAAALSLFLAQMCRLPEPYWAAISSIIVMQSDISSLENTAVNRLVGTAIGALVGALAVTFLSTTLWAFGLAVFCAILLCALLNRWETYRFAGVTVAIVMLVTHHGAPWLMGIHRFLEVSFGIGVALVVSLAWKQLVKSWG
jgi:uncharacterized membrane protein YgaE (UPF0421/DUF939 family)